MKIEELMDKERKAQYRLLQALYASKNSLLLKDLMKQSHLSKVTLLKYIDNLNHLCQEQGLACQVVLEKDIVFLEENGQLTWQELVAALLKESVAYQVLTYLCCHEQFNITALSAELMVSEATLNRQLAHLNQLLAEFDLALSQGRQVGSELQWRYFYFELWRHTLTKKGLNDLTSCIDAPHLANLFERLIGQALSKDALEQLLIWLAISQARMSFQKGYNDHFLRDSDFMTSNIFFKRLESMLLHYLRRYALEFDAFEAKSLFVFLHAYPLLPIASMKYSLGFGGPIADHISEALWLLKKAHVIIHQTKEEIIYGLGIFFSKAYFFKGAILSQPTNSQYLYQLVGEDKRALLRVIINHLVLQMGQETDFSQQLSDDILALLVFSIERHHEPLLVGLALGQNKVEAAIAELAIRRHLGHRRDFQLMPYDHQKVYDCLITYQTVYLPRQDLPYYRLKQYSSPYELTALEAFLKDLFQQKNTREEELSLSPAAKSSFAHKTV
ncbi:helix-turn-helix domain-containing protein [Streptococcus dysgalactiae]|uniref:Trans-acting positive regulator n=1 Tax=Streptococcus dysgalactiae subsp. equisimilis TaxID=119602 RepID=A0A9X8XIE1_STREQ|nr:helix-turn-helix domain-containing protein [Streptococcus dysgalactiae]SUN64740.1 trans-acting positive regulator [Streptococcus dysgalactiae subsp. equisimilis]